MVHLVPSQINYNALQLAELMFEHIYKMHGPLKNIISDRDVLFTSEFWSQLHQLIGTKLQMSSAYHPQLDGSTERANHTVTQMLWQCIHPNQKDWVSKLPAIKFAFNSARSESMGYILFFLNFGQMPWVMLWSPAVMNEYLAVRDFSLQKKLMLMSAHDSILSAWVKQTRGANRKQQNSPFKKGDLVYLSSKNIAFAKGLAWKLIPKFIGLYLILWDYGNTSFQLCRPTQPSQTPWNPWCIPLFAPVYLLEEKLVWGNDMTRLRICLGGNKVSWDYFWLDYDLQVATDLIAVAMYRAAHNYRLILLHMA